MSGAVELEAELRAEIERYIARCREMSEGGKYSWWTRLAEILATLRSDNERLTDIEDQMREAWKWLRARDLVDDLDDEWDGFTAVLDHHEAEICEQAERAVARAQSAEAERDTLLAQVEKMRSALEPFAWVGQWLFARDLPDDTPIVTIQGLGKDVHLTRGMFKAAHTAALTKEPS